MCTIYYKEGGKIPASIEKEMIDNLRKLEKSAGRKLGDTKKPLLVSVRSGAKFSMPGMMDTILNLGLNDETVESVKQETGNGRFAADSYRRFIQMFGNVVLEIPKDVFEHELDAVKKERGAKADTDLDEAALREVITRYKKVVQRRPASRFRRIRSSSSRARATRCSARGRTRARRNTAASTTFPTTSVLPSTCSRWCSATPAIARRRASASREARQPARKSSTASS